MFVADIPTIDRAMKFCWSEIQWLDKKPEEWAARKARDMRDIYELLGTLRRRIQMTGIGGKEIT